MKKSFKVLGMSCMHCQKAVHKALEENEKIQSVNVDLESANVDIECEESLTMEEIKQIIKEAGYQVG